MSDALTPQLALEYLGELEPALSAVAILDEGGRLLAGGAPGDALTASRGGYTIRAAGAGLERLIRLDLENVLEALTGGS